jgi:hypothetical protein
MELNNSVLYLQDQVNQHKQTMDIYYLLERLNFGLKDLKQLLYVIEEIGKAITFPLDKAVSKFLEDIEKK